MTITVLPRSSVGDESSAPTEIPAEDTEPDSSRSPEAWPVNDFSLTWRASSERASLCSGDQFQLFGAKVGLVAAAVLGALGLMTLVGWAAAAEPRGWVTVTVAVIVTLLFASAAIIVGAVAAWYSTGRAGFYQRVRYLKAQEVQKAVDDLGEDLSLPKLVRLNRRQLDEYHVLSVRQATIAFRNMQWAGIAAFIVLVLGIYTAFEQTDTVGQIATATLSGLGTTLSAYVSSVFYRSYRDTTDQLKHYYREPIEASRLLTAERISKDRGIAPAVRSSIVEHVLHDLESVSPPHAEPARVPEPR